MNGKLAAVVGILVVGMAAGAAASPGAGVGCSADVPVDFGTIHPQDARLAAALAEGLERSATLRALVGRIRALDGVVILSAGPWISRNDQAVFGGGMAQAITIRGRWRILSGRVESGRGDMTIGTIGHELRHAVEILEAPDAVDTVSIERLYERIGFLAHAGAYETEAAGRAERTVRDELSRCRRPSVTNR